MALGGEQLLLALDAAAVTAERSVAADHPVAGDQHADVIVAVGAADRPHCFRVADRSSDFGIAPGLAGGDLAKLAPDGFLESGSRNVDGKIRNSKRFVDGSKS